MLPGSEGVSMGGEVWSCFVDHLGRGDYHSDPGIWIFDPKRKISEPKIVTFVRFCVDPNTGMSDLNIMTVVRIVDLKRGSSTQRSRLSGRGPRNYASHHTSGGFS